MLITNAINLKAILNQNLYLPPYISLDLDLDLELNSNLNYLNLYLNPNIKPNIKPNTNNKLDINKYPDFKLGLKDLKLDFKAKKILKDIAKLRDKRLAKPNHTPYTKKL